MFSSKWLLKIALAPGEEKILSFKSWAPVEKGDKNVRVTYPEGVSTALKTDLREVFIHDLFISLTYRCVIVVGRLQPL